MNGTPAEFQSRTVTESQRDGWIFAEQKDGMRDYKQQIFNKHKNKSAIKHNISPKSIAIWKKVCYNHSVKVKLINEST